MEFYLLQVLSSHRHPYEERSYDLVGYDCIDHAKLCGLQLALMTEVLNNLIYNLITFSFGTLFITNFKFTQISIPKKEL